MFDDLLRWCVCGCSRWPPFSVHKETNCVGSAGRSPGSMCAWSLNDGFTHSSLSTKLISWAHSQSGAQWGDFFCAPFLSAPPFLLVLSWKCRSFLNPGVLSNLDASVSWWASQQVKRSRFWISWVSVCVQVYGGVRFLSFCFLAFGL